MAWHPDIARFARRGHLIDLAVGFTVGAAFSTIAKSLVTDVLMPPIGLVLGRTDYTDLFWVLAPGPRQAPPYVTLAEAQEAGAVTLNYGIFGANVVAFLIVALTMLAVVRLLHRAETQLEAVLDEPPPPPEEPIEKKCPHCRSTIAFRASRCPHCTSHLPGRALLPAPQPRRAARLSTTPPTGDAP